VARVLFWGALAMALTAGIGRLVATAISNCAHQFLAYSPNFRSGAITY